MKRKRPTFHYTPFVPTVPSIRLHCNQRVTDELNYSLRFIQLQMKCKEVEQVRELNETKGMKRGM